MYLQIILEESKTMTKEKVLVTKEQKEAIDRMLYLWRDKTKDERNGILIDEKINGGWHCSDILEGANSLSVEDFVKALCIGYEEQTIQNQLKEYYKNEVVVVDPDTWDKRYMAAWKKATNKTLELLGEEKISDWS